MIKTHNSDLNKVIKKQEKEKKLLRRRRGEAADTKDAGSLAWLPTAA